MSKNDKSAQIRHVALGAALGAAVTLALAALLVMFLALLVASGKVGEGTQRPLVVASAFLASLAGALTARLRSKNAALLSCALSAGIAVLAGLLAGLIIGSPGAFDSSDTAVCLAILCGGIAMGAVTMKRKRRRR